MPSATTAAISDSIAPSIAIANADGSSSRIDLEVERERRMARIGDLPRQDRQRRQRRDAVADLAAAERVA